MKSTEIFQLALGLQVPYKITQVAFQTEATNAKSLHIYIDFERGSKFMDEHQELCSVHDTIERTWRHLNFFQHECYLHCRVPRITSSTGKVVQVNVPWSRANSGFTLLFEAFAMQLIECEMPVNKVGNTVNEYPNRIWTIFNFWINRAYNAANHSTVTQLGIDETSSKKGHNYITLGVDLKGHNVIHAVAGKNAGTIAQIKDYLETKGCPKEQIEQVSIDLSPAFIQGATDNFPNASLTFDRFHLKKLLNEAMDEVRKNERKGHQDIKGHKYTFLKSNVNLSNRQREERDKLIILYPVLGEAYRLKELFDDFWTFKDIDEASAFLSFWSNMAIESKMQPFIKFARTLKLHWTGIVNYIQTQITNAVLESINAKIQLAKKRARGYRNIDNLINMTYFIAGKLKFDYPQYST
ncbi:MAG: ISL3 family transposase [Pseudarcicella sp.]|nr:ISL3 family transposase [Pseudarcicella sp.]MBP6410773.1 ISL3 family transposase [Pseudarcicella sp.]